MIEIIAIIILAVTNLGTLAFLSWYIYLEGKQKNKMINSLIAKNAQDFSNFEMADKIEGIKQAEPTPELPPDFQEVSTLDDETFDKKILTE